MSENELEASKRETSPEQQEHNASGPSGVGEAEPRDANEPGVLYSPSGEPIKPKNGKNGKRRRIFYIGGSVLLVVIIAGLAYWLYARQFESTDDAVVEADVTQVSPKISAYVTKIYVAGNQYVHKGDLLVDLDQSDLQVKLRQAQAQLVSARSQRGAAKATVDLTTKTASASQTTARSNVRTAQTNVRQTSLGADSKQTQIGQTQAAARTAEAALAQTRAEIPKAESDVHLAQVEYNRRLVLYDHGDISRENLDQALNALQTAQAQLSALQKQVNAAQSRVDEAEANVRTAQDNYRQSVAQIDLTRSQVDESEGRLQDANAAPERVEVSESQVGTAEATIQQADAAVAEAELELSYTKIVAPEDGFVTQKTVEEGQLVQIGTPLMAISQSDDIWVVANFKETQLEDMQPGQKVDVSIDAFPAEAFRGHVDSFQAGTGSRFSLLPAENATGNYVKVVQRVPVKIVFDEPADKLKRLVPGMSVVPSVKVR